eukprot:2418494-Rhodomonas_salina.5
MVLGSVGANSIGNEGARRLAEAMARRAPVLAPGNRSERPQLTHRVLLAGRGGRGVGASGHEPEPAERPGGVLSGRGLGRAEVDSSGPQRQQVRR